MKQFYRYLPLSDEMRHQDVYVLAGGYTHIPPNIPYPPLPHPSDHDFRWQHGRTLQEYQIIYITRGSGVFETRGCGACAIRPGSLFVLFPGEWHRYAPEADTGWDEYWVAFQGKSAPQITSENAFSVEHPLLQLTVDQSLLEEFLRIANEIRDEAIGYQRIVSARVRLIFALAATALERASYNGSDRLQIIEVAKCRLLERVDQPVNIEAIAADLHVGYSAFRKMFREYTGLSPAQYHLQLRINTARELLTTTTLPIGVVAQRLGFESAYYFARIFREKTGLPPSAYRAQAQCTDVVGP